MKDKDYIIRKIKKEEIGVLEDFLYEAIFQKDENNLLPKDIIKKPELSIYIDNFGEKDDNCLVAEYDGKIVGAVWTRIINGYGNIDEKTPELSISLYKEYRGKGIGTNMMREILKILREKGYHQTSLSVQRDNYAFEMYKNIGYQIINESEEEVVMIYKFD